MVHQLRKKVIFHSNKLDYEFELDTYGRLWVGKGSVLENPFLPLASIPDQYKGVVTEKEEYITPRLAYLFYVKYTLPSILPFIGNSNHRICKMATEYVCFCGEEGYCHAYALQKYFKSKSENQYDNLSHKCARESIFKEIEGRGNWRVRAQFLPTKYNQR